VTANLRTEYMTLSLPSPLVVSACPLSRDVETVRQLERCGAGAIVLFSLFQEQFEPVPPTRPAPADAFDRGEFLTRPQEYLDHIRRLKDTVKIPIIASLNAATVGDWLEYAHSIEEAGADALEIDIYRIVTDPTPPAAAIENEYVRIVEQVRAAIKIPLAVKLAPYFTNVSAVARRLDEAGADALVLFNRFYQPTIDIERRRIVMSLELSASAETRLPLMWIAILKGQVSADLAATSGIHDVKDVVRALMAGADVTMLCSVLLRYGPDRIADLHRHLEQWLAAHEHRAVGDIRGVMRLAAHADAEDFKRRGYTKMLNRYW
jgi:dihydroorotate dehydrogenase (fumarate)